MVSRSPACRLRSARRRTLDVGIARDGPGQEIVELTGFRIRQFTKDLIENHVEPAVLELPLVDLSDHVALKLPGQRLRALGGVGQRVVVEGSDLLRPAEKMALE